MFSARSLQLCALVAAVSTGLMCQSAVANVNASQTSPVVSQPSNSANTDQLIIRFRDGTNQATVDGVLGRMQMEKGQKFRFIKTTLQKSDVFKFDKHKKKAEWDDLKAWLQQQPDVEYVEPDYIMTKMAVTMPNDSYFSYQWPLVDAIGGIRADQAWNYSTGTNAVVAVVDTGILPHKDLLPNILPGYDMIMDSFTANDGNGRDNDPTDPGDYVLSGECGSTSNTNSSWHGTHVAGTIAAVANNAEGIAGIAYNAKILPLRVLGKCGGYNSDIADAIMWASGATVNGVPVNPTPARVINMSLGGQSACGTTLQNAINTARANKTVVVVAAGNNNTDASTFSPANCNGVISVAASGRNGSKAYYSNYGATVDVAAPGGSMLSAQTDGIVSTLNTGTKQAVADTYAFYQGTSMATPHVAGIAALMLSANPSMTPDQVESTLKSTTRAFPQTCTGCGTGIVDANAAVQAALALASNPPVDPYATQKADLSTNQTLWNSKKLLNYSYVLEQKNGTAASMILKITVRSGSVYSAVNMSTGRTLASKDLKTYGKTINQLFTAISDAITAKAATLNAAYDVTLGYPVNVYIDKSSTVAGDEVTFKASNFLAL